MMTALTPAKSITVEELLYFISQLPKEPVEYKKLLVFANEFKKEGPAEFLVFEWEVDRWVLKLNYETV